MGVAVGCWLADGQNFSSDFLFRFFSSEFGGRVGLIIGLKGGGLVVLVVVSGLPCPCSRDVQALSSELLGKLLGVIGIDIWSPCIHRPTLSGYVCIAHNMGLTPLGIVTHSLCECVLILLDGATHTCLSPSHCLKPDPSLGPSALGSTMTWG